MENCLIFVGKNRILVYNIQRFKFFYNPVVFYFAGGAVSFLGLLRECFNLNQEIF
jgi:hypothetical protein